MSWSSIPRRTGRAVRAGHPGRAGRRSLVGLAASLGLAAGLLTVVPPAAQAESGWDRGATVGRAAGGPRPTVPTVQRGISAQALPGVACRAVEGFSRTLDGSLYRLLDSAPVSPETNSLQEKGRVGSGWREGTFAWIAAGGDGVVYGLTWTGDLRWYRWVSGRWQPGTGSRIGSGFTPNTRIINIALGGDGSFYVVRTDGKLVIYRHQGRLTGAARWANASGWVIGTGWTGNEVLVPNGDGTLYRQYLGALYWYRHTDPAAGRVTWKARRTVGSGWNFYDVLSAGAGMLYATSGDTGDVFLYRHGDPVNGANTWASVRGVLKGNVREDSFGAALDPLACRLI